MSTSTGHAIALDSPLPASQLQPAARDELPRRTWQQKYRQRDAQPHNHHSQHHNQHHQHNQSSASLPPPASSYTVVESLHESVQPGSGRGGRGGRGGRSRRTQMESHNGPNQQPAAGQQAGSVQDDRRLQDEDGESQQRQQQQAPHLSESIRGNSGRGRGRGGRRGGAVATFNLTLAQRAQQAGHSNTDEDEQQQQQSHAPHSEQPHNRQPRQQRGRHPHQPTLPSHPSPQLRTGVIPQSASPAALPRPSHSHSLPSFPSPSTLSSHMIGRLKSNSYDCCICNELIKPSQPISSCGACYALLHHRCVERWWNVKRVAQGSLGGQVNWPCPSCLSMQTGSVPEYRCFCGKMVDPDVNPYITPHSCGQPCGKRRTGVTGPNACPHQCTQPCHPGPCSPCTVMLTRPCGCGRGSYQIRCGSNDPAAETCGAVCGKQLSCGHHSCQRVCHLGPCDSCTAVVTQSCWCEKEQTERLCGSEAGTDEHNKPRYSCLHTCDQTLDCGHHRCPRLCHPSSHPSCSRLPASPQPCACGKSVTDAQRTDCRDPLPTCGGRCSKLLRCGEHYCDRRCHDGDCGECSAMLRRPCRCSNETIAMPCKLVLDAEQRKQQTVSECLADGVEPPAEDELEQLFVCDRPCNVRLSCGQHKCPNRCCPPSCVHLCMRVCDKPLSCGHHRCDDHCHGQTPCPPCSIVIRQPLICHCGRTSLPPNQPCGTTLKCPHPCTRIRACGHSCTMSCHAESCDSLAPCAVLTERLCGGGHKLMKNVPCYAPSASCGVTCRKLLTCGQHSCLRPCHAGPCKEGAVADVVASCSQKCGKVRVNCTHTCKAVCHPGLPCPDVLCEESVVVKCACGRKSRTVRCNSTNFHTDSSVTVLCDEQCEVELRNARLRDILSVEPTRPVLPYPTLVMQAVLDRQLVDFCVRSEKKLNDWLDDARQATKNFPAMKSDQRWLLHQLAAHYQLTAESVDQEPNRSVRFIRQSHSAIPSVSLSSATRTYVNGKAAKSGGAPTGVDEAFLLHFVGLTVHPKLSVTDVRMMLHDWEAKYKLNWLDDDHAIAMFDERSSRDRAKERLLTRGMWRDDRDERSGASGTEANGKLTADSVCVYRKLAVNESGLLQGVSRVDRDRKKLVTDSSGFTAVVTVRRGGAVASSEAPTKPAAYLASTPSSSSAASGAGVDSVPSRRPLVTLKGLKQLQRQHGEGSSASHSHPAESPSTSPPSSHTHSARRDSTRSREGSSDVEQHVDTEQHSAAPSLSAHSNSHIPSASSATRPPAQQQQQQPALQAVVGLYVPQVEQVRRDNRWAALMDDDNSEEAEWEAVGSKRAVGRKQKKQASRAEQSPVSRPADRKAESEGREEAAVAVEANGDDWEQSASVGRGSRRNRADMSSAADHSAW